MKKLEAMVAQSNMCEGLWRKESKDDQNGSELFKKNPLILGNILERII